MATDCWEPQELLAMRYLRKPVEVIAFRWAGHLDQIPQEMSHLIETSINQVNPNDTMYLGVVETGGKNP